MRSPKGGTLPGETSLVRRVAWGSALGASAAALIAALSTSVLAAVLLARAEDRRLEEAAIILATEIGESPARVPEVVADEKNETFHSGILLAAFREDGTWVAGDRHIGLPRSTCGADAAAPIRVCRSATTHGYVAVAAAPRSHALPTLALAALGAAAFAGVAAWLASAPLARRMVAPLSRLRARIREIDVESGLPASLGPKEGVLEVDALREAMRELVLGARLAIEQAQSFAANAAHELRTPLSAVSAELELLAESSAPTTSADFRAAQQKVAVLATLVERLLILATPRRTSTDEAELVSLRDLVEDAAALLSPAHQARVTTPAGDALVEGDAVLLATMIGNALTNALKFGEHVRIEVDHAAGLAVLRIDDDGPGVDPTDRERVFEPFFRARNAVRERVPGHGLGLALVRHIARTHGGDAALVAKPTPGARLEIRLPSTGTGRPQGARDTRGGGEGMEA